MGMKEILKKRIIVKSCSKKVLNSMAVSKGGTRKIDRDSMRELLSLSNYERRNERDLELYTGYSNVLVLDNELPVYNTDVNDVVIRKSPVLKEMVKIRNIIKILWDSSAVLFKGRDTVDYVKEKCLSELKLEPNAEEMSDLKYEGIASLESKDFNGAIETLELFFELLSFEKLLKPFSVNRIDSWARVNESSKGPFVILNHETEKIWFFDRMIEDEDKESISELIKVANGFRQSFPSDQKVFEILKELSSDFI